MDARPNAPTGRRERRRLEIRSRIEDAGYGLFKRHGIEGTSIEQICLEADVARRTFYGHYGGKQDLVRALSRNRVWGSLEGLIHEVMDRHEATRDRLAALVGYIQSGIRDYDAIDRALILVLPSSPGEDDHLHQVSNSLREHCARFIRSGQEAGDATQLYSAELLADMVVGTCNTLLFDWALDPSLPIFDKLQEACRLFEDVICAGEEKPRRGRGVGTARKRRRGRA